MKMSLKDWQNNGWLSAYKVGSEEILNLLAVADRDLRECRTEGLGADWRLNIAYNSALQAARAALAASGYRTVGESHHYRVIQSLAHTIKLEPKAVNKLDAFRKKRNTSDYDMAGTVSDREAEEMIELAIKLREDVEIWLYAQHPELMGK